MKKETKQRRIEPDEDDQKDGITFDKQGRMKYHPDFHPCHGKPFTLEELTYMCRYYDFDGPRSISFAIGKTEHTIMCKISELKIANKFEMYRNLNITA